MIFSKKSTKPKELVKKHKKGRILKNTIVLLKGRQKVLNVFESRTFQKGKQGKRLTNFSNCLDCIDCVGHIVKVSDRK